MTGWLQVNGWWLLAAFLAASFAVAVLGARRQNRKARQEAKRRHPSRRASRQSTLTAREQAEWERIARELIAAREADR
jgi:membrane protein implicated in regulation of membrane protease activity